MAIKLESFEIGRLHGRRTISLEIEDNRLILVGENGTGKTTVVNALYFFLSRQWRRLAAFDLDWVTATINGHEIEVTREFLDAYQSERISRYHRMSSRLTDRVLDLLMHEDAESLMEDPDGLRDLARQYKVPMGAVLEVLREYPGSQLELMDIAPGRTGILREIVTEEVLYLPTYRRIEQDLKSVFPDIDERWMKERIERRRADTGFVELVEFGMQDVEADIQSMLSTLKEHSRRSLGELTNTFLRDVIGGSYEDITAESIESVQEATLESVFSRIDLQTLPEHARERLRQIVQRVREEQELRVEERIVAHFLLGLLAHNRAQQALERDINTFVDVCNKYLVGKAFQYDGSSVSLHVLITDQARGVEADTLSLKDFSSGEKQIVSLFSHLLLSGRQEFFILLDEPELSLSVPWQQSFLPDILATGRCTGLIAVTHSPFIFDNELDPYSHSLTEFWERA